VALVRRRVEVAAVAPRQAAAGAFDRCEATVGPGHRRTGPPRPCGRPQRNPVGVNGADGRVRDRCVLGLGIAKGREGDGQVDRVPEPVAPGQERLSPPPARLRTPRARELRGGTRTRRASHAPRRLGCGGGGEHVFGKLGAGSDGPGGLQPNLQG
jgi:hypothetical protein